nr:hypothetical protein [Lachnospiraceae bacterium]
MGDPREERAAQWQERREQRAKEVYEKKTETYAQIMEKRNKFLAENDEKLRLLREKNNLRYGVGTKQRERADRHRALLDRRKAEHERVVAKRYRETQIRERNRFENVKKDKDRVRFTRRFTGIVVVGVILFIVLAVVEVVMPGSMLKREQIIDDTPIEDRITILPSKEYKDYIGVSEEKILWDMLMEHFDGNETATLGVMCNIKAESDFEA